MECKPIVSLDELFTWKNDLTHSPEYLKMCPASLFDMHGNRRSCSDLQKVLICHDMMGGYIDDRFHKGHDDPSAYTFYHWPRIDEFVYFSHHFVTVPPCGWVDAAHTHGVPIYGTIITEAENGFHLCRRLLGSSSTVDAAVEQLVAISLHHGLDGWLLNIENTVCLDQVPMLKYLVQQLTARMHLEIAHSRVIWYDSVTSSGALSWQNQLNEQNDCFFTLCDGIFVNYGWSVSGLVESLALAGARRRDVYVGVDMFGRGNLGNGGFNVVRPTAEALWLGMSVALFAPGWTHERLGADRFPLAEDVLWTRLSPLLGARGPARLSLVTDFCQGRGRRRYADGKVTSAAPWHRLSAQSVQPTYRRAARPAWLPLTDAGLRPLTPAEVAFSLHSAAALSLLEPTTGSRDERTAGQRRIEAVCAAGEQTEQRGWQVRHTIEDGFSGGGCLIITNDGDDDGVFRLMACGLLLGAGQRSLAVVYAMKPASADTSLDRCAICVDVTDTQAPGVSRHVLGATGAPEGEPNPGQSPAWPRPEQELKSELESEPGPVAAVVCCRVLHHGPVTADRLAALLPSVTLPGPAQNGWDARHYVVPVRAGRLPQRVESVGVYVAPRSSLLLGYLAIHST